MSFCANCGNRLVDNALFCDKCGTKVIPANRANDGSPTLSHSFQDNVAQTRATHHHVGKIFLIFSIVTLVLAVAIILIILYRRSTTSTFPTDVDLYTLRNMTEAQIADYFSVPKNDARSYPTEERTCIILLDDGITMRLSDNKDFFSSYSFYGIHIGDVYDEISNNINEQFSPIDVGMNESADMHTFLEKNDPCGILLIETLDSKVSKITYSREDSNAELINEYRNASEDVNGHDSYEEDDYIQDSNYARVPELDGTYTSVDNQGLTCEIVNAYVNPLKSNFSYVKVYNDQGNGIEGFFEYTEDYSNDGYILEDTDTGIRFYFSTYDGYLLVTFYGDPGDTTDSDLIYGALSEYCGRYVKTDGGKYTPDSRNLNGESDSAEKSDDYLIDGSDSGYFDESCLIGFTAWECKVARNEIYARHGRMFKDPDLQNYFNSKSWYVPLYNSEDFDDSVLNQWERANASMIAAYEKKQGYN